MRIGVALEETWDFFNEIYEDLGQHHETSLFKRRRVSTPFLYDRINRYLFRHDLQSLMQWSDVVFFEWASHLLVAATHMPKTCGIVTRLHRYEMYRWVDKINWDVVDKIILVSEAKRREFVAQFPAQTSKIEVITEAVSLDKFHPQKKSFNGDIGILCHMTPRKRIYDLLMTFYELIQENNGFHLHIAGGLHPSHAEYFFAIQDAITELNLQDYVTLYGNIADTWNWYHNIDVFISNGYSEGLQVAPMEAMASGCYCLAHRWAGADELLPESILYYTDHELQEKILLYADTSDLEKQREMDRLRAIAATKFNIDQTKLRIRLLIEEIGNLAVSS